MEIGEENANGGAGGGSTVGKGGSGGTGSITINELGSVLNYPEKRLTLKVKDTYNIDQNKLSYIKLNEIQTEDLIIGDLSFEVSNGNTVTVNSAGQITAKELRNL